MDELKSNVDGNMIQRLSSDIFINILKRLNSPRDVAHAACVSPSWKKNVSEGNLWRVLCIKSFPEVERFEWVDDDTGEIQNDNVGISSESSVLRKREMESSTYKYLLRELLFPPIEESCISKPLHASSTDHYPQESIAGTLYPVRIRRYGETCSYWSSKGQSSVEVPEMLTYLLISKLCVIHTIKIQPFKALYPQGLTIYSAKTVRFRFGYFGSLTCQDTSDGLSLAHDKTNFDDYVWTYVSPEFPMKQEGSLQSFKLPRPVLCIGGVLHIELLGRVQNHVEDGLYYICVFSLAVQKRGKDTNVGIPTPEECFCRDVFKESTSYFPSPNPQPNPYLVLPDELETFDNHIKGYEEELEEVEAEPKLMLLQCSRHITWLVERLSVAYVHVYGRPLCGFDIEPITHQKNFRLRCIQNNNKHVRDKFLPITSHEGTSVGSSGLLAEGLR